MLIKKTLCLLLLALSALAGATGSSINAGSSDAADMGTPVAPGVIASLNVGGLDKFARRVVPSALEALTKLTFDGISGTETGFEYSVTNIHVTSAKTSGVSVSLTSGLTVGVDNAAFSAEMDWSYRLAIFPHLPSGSGSATASLACSHFAATLEVGAVQTAKGLAPQFRVKDVAIDIDSIDVKTAESMFSWLYNLIVRLFKGKIKTTLENAIKTTMVSTVNAFADTIVQSMLLRVPVGPLAVLDLSLTEAPILSKTAVSMLFNGEMYPATTGKSDGAVPRVPQSLPAAGPMLALSLSSFVPQTLLHVLHKSGAFAFTFDGTNPPPLWPVAFNSKAWTMVPQLQATFPDADLRIVLSFAREFNVSISSKGLDMGGLMSFKTEAKVGTSWKAAFVVHVALAGAANMWFDATDPADPLLKLNIAKFTSSLSLAETAIGQFSVDKLDKEIATVVSGVVVPFINQVFASGLPLPTVRGLRLVGTQLTLAAGTAVLTTDIDYQPTAEVLAVLRAAALSAVGAVTTEAAAPRTVARARALSARADVDADADEEY